MRPILLFVLILFAGSGVALAKSAGPGFDPALARLPLTPGVWQIAGAVTSTGEGLVRIGPGGHSLVLESPDAMEVVTHDAGSRSYRLDRYPAAAAEAPSRLEGTLSEDGVVRFTSKTDSVTWTRDGDAVTIRRERRASRKADPVVTSQRWMRGVPKPIGRATGVGGIFFKANDAKKLREWYSRTLSLPLGEGGYWIDIRWRELDDPSHVGRTVWGAFKKETKHFDGPFMVNYRVDRLDALLEKLRAAGVTIEKTEDEPGNGRFAWIRDPEGNLVELWEPPPGG